ncbi:exported protein of unknown function [Paraburkholderia dioscoreae]|uniref:Uncharacterized protein n=1 Tax=Paraburkholderia dioscoreae TaxID=2604047 RepID=A0A5Q4ZS96_9BURK|nr:exported protein of unknown function [Paraburkholderia dioscoreae]
MFCLPGWSRRYPLRIRRYQPMQFLFTYEPYVMKKAVLALAVAAASLCAVSPASANPHHRSCHRVMVHHHWQNHCR